jgi:hypothetical protein
MVWRHIKNDFKEAEMMPKGADFKKLLHPKWNKGWKVPEQGNLSYNSIPNAIDGRPSITRVQFMIPAGPPHLPFGRPKGETNTFATHFPIAGANPDPEYASDDVVKCPEEGKIAILDFVWSGAHKNFDNLYLSQFMVDGVLLYDRIKMMAEAANFKVNLFKDAEINLGNFKKLEDYTIVIIIGHGGITGRETIERLGQGFPIMWATEGYEPTKITNTGITYEEAWKKGYILYGADDKQIAWSPLLFKDLYKPKTEQLWMPNTCWGMLPWDVDVWGRQMQGKIYNFGDGLMDAGVKVVFGYVGSATPEAIVINTMVFFRRLLGGYYINDAPPSPHIFWPTCMSAQTFFRRPSTPKLSNYENQCHNDSVYTMYAVDEPKFFRKVCNPSNRHAYLQSFMLRVGTPATAFTNCWNNYWGKGEKVSGLRDSICGQGDFPTTEQGTVNAACAVKIARKVTNAMLKR